MSHQPTSIIEGIVKEFDEPVGLGVLTSVEGNEYPFHCTAIADGSRDIPTGAEVMFRLIPAQLGRYEATDILALD